MAIPDAFSVPLPKLVVPSMNVTVPVGTGRPEVVGDTVAVNVTGWPNVEGLGVAASTMDGVAAAAASRLSRKVGSMPFGDGSAAADAEVFGVHIIRKGYDIPFVTGMVYVPIP